MLPTLIMLVLLAVHLPASDFTLEPAPLGNPSSTPLPLGKPWVPGWCRWDWRAGWVGMHQEFIATSKKRGKDIAVIFYGDSITMGWSNEGKNVFEEFYASHGAVNYGIGGDSTRQLLYRIANGEVDGLTPQVVILKIGTNNLYDDANKGTNEEIAQGITAVVSLLRAKLPNSKVLLLGVLPRQNDWFSGRATKINALIAKLDDGKSIRYLDMSPHFASAPGKIKPELYNKDQLHLVKSGYEVWAKVMTPLFNEMMSEK
jgi:lysophospholipase L1-like esterase